MVSPASKSLYSIFFALSTMLSVDSFLSPSALYTTARYPAGSSELFRRRTPFSPSLCGARTTLRMSDAVPAGSVYQQREDLNRQMLEREAAYEGMKRRIRAESFEHGEADYRGLFARFDRDKNGALDRREFEQLCGQMGMRQALTEEERQIILSEASNNADGLVRVREFLAWVSSNAPHFTRSPPAPAPAPSLTPEARPERGARLGAAPAAKVSAAKRRSGGAGEGKGGGREKGRVWSYGESFLEQAQLQLPQPPPPPQTSAKEEEEEEEGAGKGEVRSARMSSSSSSSSSSKRAAPPATGRKGAGRTVGVGGTETELERAASLVRGWVGEEEVGEEELRDVLHFLVLELGVAEHSLVGIAVNAPGIFGMSVARGLEPNVEFLREAGLSKAQICKLCVSFPQVLQSSVARKEETALYLEELGVGREKLGRILASNPQLLRLSIRSNLQPTVEFLVQEAGVPRAKLGAIILAFPNVLSYSLQLNLRPKLRFLLEEVGVDKARVGAILTKFPQILGLSVSGNLRPTVQYMVEELGLEAREVGKIVQQHPQLLGLSVEANLKLKVAYLVEELGLPVARLRAVISAFPTLLSLSVTANLRPKVQFLLEEAGYDLEDIARSPNLLAYSLERRMRPRFAQLQRMGTRVALGSLLSYSDKDFEKRFGGSA